MTLDCDRCSELLCVQQQASGEWTSRWECWAEGPVPRLHEKVKYPRVRTTDRLAANYLLGQNHAANHGPRDGQWHYILIHGPRSAIPLGNSHSLRPLPSTASRRALDTDQSPLPGTKAQSDVETRGSLGNVVLTWTFDENVADLHQDLTKNDRAELHDLCI